MMSEAISGPVTRGRFWPFAAAAAAAWCNRFSCRFTERCRSGGHGGRERADGTHGGSHTSLNMTFARALRFAKLVGSAIKTSFAQLRLLAKIKGYLWPKDLGRRVIHAFINTRLDRRLSVCVGSRQSLLHRLQLVQLVSSPGSKSGSDAGSCFLFVCLVVLKALNARPPHCLAELLHFRTPARAPRSADQLLLEVNMAKLCDIQLLDVRKN